MLICSSLIAGPLPNAIVDVLIGLTVIKPPKISLKVPSVIFEEINILIAKSSRVMPKQIRINFLVIFFFIGKYFQLS